MVKGVVRRAGRARPRSAASPSGIVDDVTHLSLPAGRRLRGARRRPSPRCSSGSAPTAPSARTRTPSRSSARTPTTTPRATSSTTPRSPASVDRLPPAVRPRARSARPTWSTQADFVAVHQFGLLEKMKVLELAKPGATFLLNSPYPADEVWGQLPVEVQQQIIDKRLRFFVIDAVQAGQGGRPRHAHQHRHAAVLLPPVRGPARDRGGRRRSRHAVEDAYGKRGRAVVERNFAAIDRALAELVEVDGARRRSTGDLHRMPPLPDARPGLRQERHRARCSPARATCCRSAPCRSTAPGPPTPPAGRSGPSPRRSRSGTRASASTAASARSPARTPRSGSRSSRRRASPTPPRASSPRSTTRATCRTTCSPSRSPRTTAPAAGSASTSARPTARPRSKHKSINMEPALEHRDAERPNYDFFLTIPEIDRDHGAPRHGQGCRPAAAAVRVLRRLLRLRRDAVHQDPHPAVRRPAWSSPTRPAARRSTAATCPPRRTRRTPTGAGPAWSNSLFEDNAEFGLGLRLGWERHHAEARRYLEELRGVVGDRAGRRPARTPTRRRGRASPPSATGSQQLKDVLRRARTAAPPRRRRQLRHPRRRPGRQERLDHRRRRLGLRHRVRRPGPRARLGAQRQHPRARHRGLLQHRWPGVEGHPARCRRRSSPPPARAGAKKDLGADRPGLRQRLRGPDRHRRQRAADGAGHARGRRRGPGPSIVIAYSTCIAHGIEMSHVDGAPEGRRGQRLLAAVPVPAERGGGQRTRSSWTPRSRASRCATFMQAETRFSMLARTRPRARPST